jgi:hypothetical protein
MARRKMKKLRQSCAAIEATLTAQLDAMGDQGKPSATLGFYDLN